MNSGRIQLAHGGGGRLSRSLIESLIVPRFGKGPLSGLPDSASLKATSSELLFTTDSFVVQPPFFPGGDIGQLAVHGTVNDIAVAGGKPHWLSLAFILEEGLPVSMLEQILDSIKDAAEDASVQIVTGDTKVVARGQCDKLYINTSGVGFRIPGLYPRPSAIQEDDAIIVSGNIGDHGMAVLAAREELALENGPVSDTASIHRLVSQTQKNAASVHFMRDPTRGGVATVLYEAAQDTNFDFVLDEASIPLSRGTSAAAELLGLDPLNSPCEGRLIMICNNEDSSEITKEWQSMPEGRQCRRIGSVKKGSGRVILETLAGGRRLITPPSGELLPRIC